MLIWQLTEECCKVADGLRVAMLETQHCAVWRWQIRRPFQTIFGDPKYVCIDFQDLDGSCAPEDGEVADV
jgi:hypothetical protein